MNYNQITKILNFNEQESKVFMPNEIFEDLQNNIKKTIHIPVAYSYYYLISWLYRNAKYGDFKIDNKKMKEILGYKAESKGLDYLFKKDGLLDLMGYTRTEKDFPIFWTFDDKELEFTTFEQMDEFYQEMIKRDLNRKYTVKFPVKAFHRHIDDEEMQDDYEHGYEDGTFFDISNTHCIPFEIFMYCMDKPDIGCTGFYIYSFLKMGNQRYNGNFDIPMRTLADKLGLPYSSMTNKLSIIRKYKMVTGIHNQKVFSLAMNENERKANSYLTHDWGEKDSFLDKPVDYEMIKVMKFKDYKTKVEEDKGESFPLNLLPY